MSKEKKKSYKHHKSLKYKSLDSIPVLRADEPMIDKLADIFKQGCNLLVGAGISRSQFPLAIDFKHTIITTLVENAYNVKKEEINTFISKDPWKLTSLEALLGLANDALGRETSLSIINVFRGGSPGSYHRFIAQCLQHRYVGSVYTTNFDELLEAASRELGLTYQLEVYSKTNDPVSLDGPVPIKTTEQISPKIIKLHGTVSQPESILTVIGDIYNAKKSPILSDLRVDIESIPLVVAGYSGSDLLDVMPLIQSARIKQLIWILHVPNHSSVSRAIRSIPTPTRRYLNYFSRQSGSVILAADTSMVFEQMAKILKIQFEPATGRGRKNVELPEFASLVQSHPTESWELLDRSNALGRVPPDQIVRYIRSKDPDVNTRWNIGAVSTWRVVYAFADKELTRQVARAYRSYVLSLYRHRELDTGNYSINALLKAWEMFSFLDDTDYALDMEMRGIQHRIGQGDVPFSLERLKSKVDELKLESLSVKIVVREAEVAYLRSVHNERNLIIAHDLLISIRERVSNLDEVELQVSYDALVLAVAGRLQTRLQEQAPFGYIWRWEERWEQWLDHFLECASRYAKNISAGVPLPIGTDNNLILETIARVLIDTFGQEARDYLWSNNEFYLSGLQREIELCIDQI